MVETVTVLLLWYIIIVLVIWAGLIAGAVWLANEKGRNTTVWGILTAFFGILAIIILGLSPNKRKQSND